MDKQLDRSIFGVQILAEWFIRLLMNILGEEEACARGVFCK
jgi:hypothetical protein